jgi:acetyl esterase/lipase
VQFPQIEDEKMINPTEIVFGHLRALAARSVERIHDLGAWRNLVDQYFCVHPSTSEVQGRWYPVRTGHIAMEWVVADTADPKHRILYLHGGSWVSGSLSGYRAFLSRVSQAAKAVVLSVDYRLAPEHLFPAGLEDCVQAYLWMQENGPDGKEPAGAAYLMGDSAGGNLALSALLKVRDSKLALPAAVIAISPATDFTCSSPSLLSRAAIDPIINPTMVPTLIRTYLGTNVPPTNPYASPLFGDYRGMPPLLLQVGDAEVLLDDSTRLATHATSQGCEVTLEVWKGMPHVFQGFAPFLPEASEAIAKIGEYIQQH